MAGLALMAVSVSPLIEGVFLVCSAEIGIALLLTATGWWLHKSATNHSGAHVSVARRSLLTRWLRFIAAAVPIVLIVYILGYFAFMDRQSPTHPAGNFKRFPSSFRWAPREWVRKAMVAYATPWKEPTIWNVIYDPMDRFWFRFFPRTRAEEDRLRALGYYR